MSLPPTSAPASADSASAPTLCSSGLTIKDGMGVFARRRRLSSLVDIAAVSEALSAVAAQQLSGREEGGGLQQPLPVLPLQQPAAPS